VSIKRVVDSLLSFQGNARSCIVVEPMWGISYNLFVPYASLYMLALGVSNTGIGSIATISMVIAMFWSLSGGWITDRFGRHRTTLVFDLMSWTIPTILWTFAQDFRWFLVAGILNSAVRVVHISWTCLLVEDTPPSSRVRLYTWISVAGTLSGFFAPLAGFLVARYGLVPATRGLYFFAFLAMTAMFFIRNAITTETAMGIQKLKESRHGDLRKSLGEYADAFRILFGQRDVALAFFLSVLSNIHMQTRSSFHSIVLTRGVGLPASMIALFPFMASVITLLVYLLVIPKIKAIKKALTLALSMNVLGNLIFFFAPARDQSVGLSLAAVILGTVCVALGMGVAGPVIDAVVANSLDDKKRAMIMSIFYTLLYAITAPFGWFAGFLADISPRIPSVLMASVMGISVLLALRLRKEQ